jgi:hypothetical protein
MRKLYERIKKLRAGQKNVRGLPAKPKLSEDYMLRILDVVLKL